MNTVSLTAKPRSPGKGAARAVRRAGDVPCIMYGRHVASLPFSTSEKSLHPLIQTAKAHVVRITMGDDAWECVVKDIDFHPVTDRPMHVDFQVLHPGEAITLSVPVHYIGTSVGQTRGGRVRHTITELTVACLPRHIPAQIDVDVTNVAIGDAIHVRDLSLENLDIHAPDSQILMSVERPRIEIVEDDDVEGDEDGAEDGAEDGIL